MTLNRWLVVLVSTVGLIACSDSTAPDPAGRLEATWAGKAWAGDASAVLTSYNPGGPRLYVYATGPSRPSKPGAWWYGPELAIWPNEIAVNVAFNGVGTYVLGPGSATFQEIVGGDVIDATYSIAPQTTGTLVITSYEAGGMIEGVVSFEAVSSNPYRSFGDRAKLEDGHFRAKVQPGFLL